MNESRGSLTGLWRGALAEAAAARDEPDDLRLGLLYLKSWPDIPGLSPALAAPVVRVCALLSHKPTVGFLVGRMLDLPEDESRPLLRVLHRFGHVDVLQRKAAAEPAQAGESPGAAAPSSIQGAFLGRIWKTLVSR